MYTWIYAIWSGRVRAGARHFGDAVTALWAAIAVVSTATASTEACYTAGDHARATWAPKVRRLLC